MKQPELLLHSVSPMWSKLLFVNYCGYWNYLSVLMMLELSERLFSECCVFFCLYVVLTDIFRLRYSYFIFICVGQNLYFHRLLWVDEWSSLFYF
jgi:hypothetical protein